MIDSSNFLPNWASPPGDTIYDVLTERNLSRTEFAERMGVSNEVAEALLAGRMSITIGLARRLSEVIGASISFWMLRDQQYRQSVAHLRNIEQEWVESMPVADMVKLGWLRQQPARNDNIDSLLQYFDVSSVAAWKGRYEHLLKIAAYRTSPSFPSSPAAIAAWLRQGERLAKELPCKPWNPDRLIEALKSVRKLTRVHDPERFLPRLSAAASACGVAVVALRAPAGCRASGATLWINSEKALLLLSGRHLSDDHFWFTFYHECGHLLLHHEKELILESEEEIDSKQEHEANAFAADMLVSPQIRTALETIPLNTKSIIRLAVHAEIAPGIIVGQLQKMGRLRLDRLNGLKRRFVWSGDKLVSRRRT